VEAEDRNETATRPKRDRNETATKMCRFHSLNEDTIVEIADYMHVSILLNFLRTCKRLYGARKYILQNNSLLQAYNKYSNGAFYLRLFYKSDLCYEADDLRININIVTEPSAKEQINNTYKLIAFNCDYYDAEKSVVKRNMNLLCNYYAMQIELKYPAYKLGNTTRTKKSKDVFSQFMKKINWFYTNIDMYDIFECVYHVHYNNKRKLAEVLENMQVQPPKDPWTFVKVCITYTLYVGKLHDDFAYEKLMKTVMISILYKFMDKSPIEVIPKSMHEMLIEQVQMLNSQIERLKRTPKYLKKSLSAPLNGILQKIRH
jgi:hypothetical protein